jgi:recombination protein RecA
MAAKKPSSAQQVMNRVNAQMKRKVVGMATDERFIARRVPTGSLTIDRITGGGLVRGRHVETVGDFSAGKSHMLYRTMALAQQRGEVCALFDGEHVFDESWFRHLGGDPGNLLIERPDTMEEMVKLLMLYVQRAPGVEPANIIGVDSVASMMTKEEREKDLEEGDDRVASLARAMSRGLRRVTTMNTDTLIIWTNQWRDKIGPFPGKTSPGGRSLGFYASTRIAMVMDQKVKHTKKVAVRGKMVDRDVIIGHWIQVRAEKEKTTRPYQQGMFYFDAEKGCIDLATEVVHLGMEDEIIEQAVNSRKQTVYVYDDEQGEEWRGTLAQWRSFLAEQDDLREELIDLIQENTIILGGME